MSGEVLPKVKGLILDMDGVLWRDRTPIGDLPRIFEHIRQSDWKVMLATNNATLSAAQFCEKLVGFGVVVEPWQVVNSSQAVADYLKELHPDGGPVFIIGEQGLSLELESKGFYITDNEQPLAVIVGLDRSINYEKLKRAGLLVRGGVPFIATNPDKTYPTPEGLVPGAGTFVAAVQAASDCVPIIIGKPEPEIYQVALKRMGLTPSETLVVGDRLETDIAGAQRLGCFTGVVLSGVSTFHEAMNWQPRPDYIADDLSSLLGIG